MICFRLLFIFLLAISCAKTAPNSPPPAKPLVLVSIAPYQLFAERIGAGRIDVRSIVPPGSNAHHFEPTARQMESLQSGQVWFRIGEPFERPFLALFQDRWHIVDLREIVGEVSEGEDRHFWMSPSLAKIQAEVIANTLAEQFPTYAEEFKTNLQALLQDLDKLDRDIRLILDPLKDRSLLVSHPAFGHFCRDYALHQLSVEQEGKDPRPRHLESLLADIKEQKPEVAITLPQHNNRGAQLIAEELQLPLAMVDPYSHEYFEMMLILTKSIAGPR